MALGFAKSYTSAFHRDADIVLEVRGGMTYRNQWVIMGITVSEHRMRSELNMLVLGKTVYFQLRLQKEEAHKAKGPTQ